ncbi:MAG: pyridoxal phosphate-dependent aminotransferase [Saprospirales bacterium]|nr:pyridoxal phosphate-dependent aminotransferase [Saprospirales bacterium]
MPHISQRAEKMPASPIRKLVPYAEGAKKRGTHVYSLNIGQPDIETPPQFFEAIRQADLKVLSYSHSAGIEPLRNKIAQYYTNLGLPLDFEQVLVTTGASEALLFAFMACLNPGDEIILPEPFYANYISFALTAGIKIVPIPTRIEDNFDLPPMETFEKLITPRTKAIMICNPGNPTGILYPLASLEKLRDIVLKHDLFLFADEVYREFVYDGQTHFSILGFKDLENHAIVVDSISKRFSACGARIGCVVTRNKAVMGSILKYAQARLSPPTMGQIGAEAIYDMPQSFYDGVIKEYDARRTFMLSALHEMEGVFCPQVGGAFYAMVKLPVDDAEKFCIWMLDNFSYKGATVMMAPGNGFYTDPEDGKQQVRIAYVLNQKDLAAAMECLAEGLKAYPGRLVEELLDAKTNS